MKTTLLTLIAFAITLISFGQTPEAFKYQAVVRDGGGIILTNQDVGYQLTILQDSPSGTAVYTENFSPTTNGYGLVNLEIGTGTTTDDFTMIDWVNGPYFMETAVDITGGTSYTVMGTSQLMSVPYALHAKTADSIIEPIYTIGLWPELGGYVFWVSADGKHGLVVETQDQCNSCSWYIAQDTISSPASHSIDGELFRDWRMPTKYELNEIFIQRALIGGFVGVGYWCSSEINYEVSGNQHFITGLQDNFFKNFNSSIRSVRAF
jgi:hypothetical protein